MLNLAPTALFIGAAAIAAWSLVTTLRNAWPAIVETVIAATGRSDFE